MATIDSPDADPVGWRRSRSLAIVELALVVALLVADRHDLVPLSNTPFLLALGWLSLRLRGLGWRDVGLVRPRRWLPTLALGVAAGVAIELFALWVSEPLLARLAGAHPELSEFRPLVGNLQLLLVLVLANWVLAAFGEEMAWRGYVMNRVAGLGGGGRGPWAVALIVTSALFGIAHGESQGLTGMLQEGLSGLFLGLLYLGCGRTLGAPIVAHGVSNTLAFVLIYLGRYPGV